MFSHLFERFGILGWIRSGDAVKNQIEILRFRHLFEKSAFESEVVVFEALGRDCLWNAAGNAFIC